MYALNLRNPKESVVWSHSRDIVPNVFVARTPLSFLPIHFLDFFVLVTKIEIFDLGPNTVPPPQKHLKP